MFSLFAGALTSCLDEDPLHDSSKSENIIEFFDIGAISSPVDASYPLYVSTFKLSEAEQFDVIISYSGALSNDEDITVNVELDPIALEKYNAEQGGVYEVLPESLYTAPSFTVTIPKGQTKAVLRFSLNTINFDFSKAYALPLTIVSSSKGVISGNFGTAIFSVGGKNKFDGVYAVEGTMVDAFGAFTGFYPTEIEFRTIDANTVNRYDRELGSNLHGIIQNGTGALFVFGTFSIQFDLDEDGTVTDARNSVASATRSGKLGTGINKMTFKADGTPDTMEVTYIMVQSGSDRAVFTETLTYIGER
jgi:hypothetical protein